MYGFVGAAFHTPRIVDRAHLVSGTTLSALDGVVDVVDVVDVLDIVDVVSSAAAVSALVTAALSRFSLFDHSSIGSSPRRHPLASRQTYMVDLSPVIITKSPCT